MFQPIVASAQASISATLIKGLIPLLAMITMVQEVGAPLRHRQTSPAETSAAATRAREEAAAREEAQDNQRRGRLRSQSEAQQVQAEREEAADSGRRKRLSENLATQNQDPVMNSIDRAENNVRKRRASIQKSLDDAQQKIADAQSMPLKKLKETEERFSKARRQTLEDVTAAQKKFEATSKQVLGAPERALKQISATRQKVLKDVNAIKNAAVKDASAMKKLLLAIKAQAQKDKAALQAAFVKTKNSIVQAFNVTKNAISVKLAAAKKAYDSDPNVRKVALGAAIGVGAAAILGGAAYALSQFKSQKQALDKELRNAVTTRDASLKAAETKHTQDLKAIEGKEQASLAGIQQQMTDIQTKVNDQIQQVMGKIPGGAALGGAGPGALLQKINAGAIIGPPVKEKDITTPHLSAREKFLKAEDRSDVTSLYDIATADDLPPGAPPTSSSIHDTKLKEKAADEVVAVTVGQDGTVMEPGILQDTFGNKRQGSGRDPALERQLNKLYTDYRATMGKTPEDQKLMDSVSRDLKQSIESTPAPPLASITVSPDDVRKVTGGATMATDQAIAQMDVLSRRTSPYYDRPYAGIKILPRDQQPWTSKSLPQGGFLSEDAKRTAAQHQAQAKLTYDGFMQDLNQRTQQQVMANEAWRRKVEAEWEK